MVYALFMTLSHDWLDPQRLDNLTNEFFIPVCRPWLETFTNWTCLHPSYTKLVRYCDRDCTVGIQITHS